MMTITPFGTLDGKEVLCATLSEGDTSVSILNYGAVTQDWRVAVNGTPTSMVLGFDRFEDYVLHSRSFGIIAGRVANRTAFGRFTLDGQTYQLATNNGEHHLHGGDVGLGRRMWRMEPDSDANALQLTYHSPDGEDHYPGAVDFTVTVTLKNGAVSYEMEGMPDRITPINLAQHNYYNLAGGGDVLRHHLKMPASRYTPVDAGLIPTGETAPVAGTHLDFTKGAQIGAIDPNRIGIDLNLVLDAERDPSAPAAVLGHDNGCVLRLWTDQPGIQVFDAPAMDIPVPGLNNTTYGGFGGVCLEAQHFPNALNTPHFPQILSSPEMPYRQVLRIAIGSSNG